MPHEVRKLADGVRRRELVSPAVVKFHVARMGFVADDDSRQAAGNAPIGARSFLLIGERVLVQVSPVLEIDLFRTESYYFVRNRVFDTFATRGGDTRLIFFLA